MVFRMKTHDSLGEMNSYRTPTDRSPVGQLLAIHDEIDLVVGSGLHLPPRPQLAGVNRTSSYAGGAGGSERDLDRREHGVADVRVRVAEHPILGRLDHRGLVVVVVVVVGVVVSGEWWRGKRGQARLNI